MSNDQRNNLIILTQQTMTIKFAFFRLALLGFAIGQDDIEIKNLKDNPGILPFKLGQAKIQKASLTLLHFYDLLPIINETNKIHSLHYDLKNSIHKNAMIYAERLTNFDMTVTSLLKAVNTKLDDILPFHANQKRNKRGLINGLGSVFKAITGNLDASDGAKYDAAISKFETNQNTMMNAMNTQVTINTEMVNKFRNITESIKHNEQLIRSRISKIYNFVNKTTTQLYDYETYFHIRDIYDQLIINLNIMFEVLSDIENSIVFARQKIFHPSILPTSMLLEQLMKIENQSPKLKLPLPASIENIHAYENIISIESYFSKNKLVFLLKVPLVSDQLFEYFHFYSIPILINDKHFSTIIPTNKYLLLAEPLHAYSKEICKKMKPRNFICFNTNMVEEAAEDPCEIQLLRLKSNGSNCKPYRLTIPKLMVQQIEETNKWILITPETVKLKAKCKSETIHNLLGTYLITLPMNCSFETPHNEIYNHEYVIPQKTLIELPSLPSLTNENNASPVPFEPIHLTDLKLDELNNYGSRMRNSLPKIQPTEFFETHVNVWTTALYILLGAILLHFIYKRWFIKFKCQKSSRQQPVEELTATPTTPNLDQVNIPARCPRLSSREGGVM